MDKKKIGLVAAGLIVAAGLAAFGLRPDPQVTVTRLSKGEVVAAIYSTGVVASERSATLRASVSGNVRPLPYQSGDRVEAGRVLIALDAASQQLAIAEAEANVKQAKASVAQALSNLELLQRGARTEEIAQASAALAQARADLKGSELEFGRTERLFRSSAATQAQLDADRQRLEAGQARVLQAQAQLAVLEGGSRKEQVAASEAQLAVSRAQLAQREAQLARARQGIGDYELVAPFAGLLSGYLVQEGDSVSPGTALATLVDPERFVIKTAIDEVDILKVKPGQEALVALDARPDATLAGKVERIVPKTDPVAKTAEVIVRIEKLPEGVLEGMTATVNLVSERRQALTIPAAALVREGESAFVWRVGAEGLLERVPFEAGIQDGNRVESRGDALQAADAVVDAPAKALREGRRVRVKDR